MIKKEIENTNLNEEKEYGIQGFLISDLNNDKLMDIIIPIHIRNTLLHMLYISIANDRGYFDMKDILYMDEDVFSEMFFDCDGDQNVDIIGVGLEKLSISKGKGDGTFMETIYNDSYNNVLILYSDYNKDDIMDIIAIRWEYPEKMLYFNKDIIIIKDREKSSIPISVILGKGDGTFES